MNRNLKTVVISTATNTLKTFDGWYVSPKGNNEYLIEGLGSVKNPSNIVCQSTNHFHYLHELSISRKEIEVPRLVSAEDNYFGHEDTNKVSVLELSATADDLVYYRILGNAISLSKDFEVFLKTKIREPYTENYTTTVVYAALPADYPLVLDQRGTLCVSPV